MDQRWPFSVPDCEFEGYIFDHDGTLVHSMGLHYEAWLDAFERSGAKFEFPRKLAQSLAGVDMYETVEILNARFDESMDPARVVADQERYYFEHVDQVEPNHPLIEFVKETAVLKPVSIASGSLRETVDRTMTAAGIIDLFTVIVTTEDVKNGKPAPDMFFLAAEKMGVRPERCLVFEDGELGAQGARAAGMEVVMVEPG